MKEVSNVTDSPLQEVSILLEDGTTFRMVLYFIQMQYGWIIRSLEYGDITIKGMRICNSPNILHQFKNILPFGIACISEEEREPMLLEDFSSGKTKLYILSEDEVDQYQGFISGEV